MTVEEIEKLERLRARVKPAGRAISGSYAGAVCPKCGQGMNHKQNITLSEEDEARDRKRYGRGICDDCKTERQQQK